MLKILHYVSNRFNKKNWWKSLLIYGSAFVILIFWGVKGLMISFFLGLFFVFGWFAKSAIDFVKDYRLTMRLNRVHFAQADYETLKRENKALLGQLTSVLTGANTGRGGAPSGLVRSAPPSALAKTERYSAEQLEEMRLRYEMEEKEQ